LDGRLEDAWAMMSLMPSLEVDNPGSPHGLLLIREASPEAGSFMAAPFAVIDATSGAMCDVGFEVGLEEAAISGSTALPLVSYHLSVLGVLNESRPYWADIDA